MDTKENPWALPIEMIFEYLKTSDKGLTTVEAQKRLEKYGPNRITEKEKRHGLEIFVSQFKNALILILMGAAVISYFLGEKIDFFRSTPSTWLVMASVVTGCAAVVLTYVGIGHILFGFVRMPLGVLMLVGGVLLAYFVAVEAAKRRFFATAEL